MAGLRNHWEWRGGWRPGRHKYACHLLPDDQRDLRDLIGHYQEAVEQVQILDPVPARWLHLTMQSIAFVDQLDEDENQLGRVTETLRGRLADFAAPTVTFHRPAIWTEAVVLQADPREPLYELRLAVHDSVADALNGTFTQPRPQPGDFNPHVTIAYANSDAPDDGPIRAALRTVNPQPATVKFPAASLIELNRDHQMWEWTEVARLPFRA
ncbi:MAG: 2'-5' RNA ligase family protein [Acidimicrobiaceae bacterium]|nr:2'-5' RNA ligase family protein [Acidimicrobiaceae bacterium]